MGIRKQVRLTCACYSYLPSQGIWLNWGFKLGVWAILARPVAVRFLCWRVTHLPRHRECTEHTRQTDWHQASYISSKFGLDSNTLTWSLPTTPTPLSHSRKEQLFPYQGPWSLFYFWERKAWLQLIGHWNIYYQHNRSSSHDRGPCMLPLLKRIN